MRSCCEPGQQSFLLLSSSTFAKYLGFLGQGEHLDTVTSKDLDEFDVLWLD